MGYVAHGNAESPMHARRLLLKQCRWNGTSAAALFTRTSKQHSTGVMQEVAVGACMRVRKRGWVPPSGHVQRKVEAVLGLACEGQRAASQRIAELPQG